VEEEGAGLRRHDADVSDLARLDGLVDVQIRQLNPCVRSRVVSSRITGSPSLSSMTEGVNLNLSAVTWMTFSCAFTLATGMVARTAANAGPGSGAICASVGSDSSRRLHRRSASSESSLSVNTTRDSSTEISRNPRPRRGWAGSRAPARAWAAKAAQGAER